MAEEARKSPKFSWDYDVPNTPFWNSLDYRLSRNFLQCYTEAEIAQFDLDETLSVDDKIECLRTLLENTLAEKGTKVSPKSLHDADYEAWRSLKLGISTMDHFLGNQAEEAATVKEMYENGPEGTKNMSALHNLSAITEAAGNYSEAERMALEVLPWLEGHEKLGPGSPQALSSMKCLARSTWKQEKFDDANQWIEKCRLQLKQMAEGQFSKYYESEAGMLENDLDALKKWKEEQGK